mgnify:CR=1 FL=1
MTSDLIWNNRFARLGENFYTRLQPQALPEPYWISRNQAVARELGLEASWFESQDVLQALSGSGVLPGSDPLASVYSGHQFGQWAGQLGDGRAILLGELESVNGGMEIQLKGAGKTPYSRMGDGRAVLRSSIREYLCSEAMHGLGIPTTRALCLTGSDAKVVREEIETAAVVTRTAPSFIRFGHFEHFSYNDMPMELKALADFVIDSFYPACRASANPYAALLEAVSERTAHLMAAWQSVGFCHGVMNTDNMSILVFFPAIGAIAGNLISHRMDRHIHVIGSYIALGVLIACYELLVQGFWSGAVSLVFLGGLFAAPTNVLDARLMAFAATQGNPGRGATVMSLVHNVFILAIGSSLAVALFLGWMLPVDQFYSLAGVSVVTALVVIWAHLDDSDVAASEVTTKSQSISKK